MGLQGRTALFVAGIAAAAALPFAARALRGDRSDRCALDGIAVSGPARVRVVAADGSARNFCCIDCAVQWTKRTNATPREVRVADEITGEEIDAATAWFVASRVVTSAVTGCNIHSFAKQSDARAHAAAFGGSVLEGSERPFAAR
jgi:nitrous oxide reductase accessory protein NosL